MPLLKCFSSRLTVAFAHFIEARCEVENEDVVGAAPTGDAPTTSERSTFLLPTKVPLILEIWWYLQLLWNHLDLQYSDNEPQKGSREFAK